MNTPKQEASGSNDKGKGCHGCSRWESVPPEIGRAVLVGNKGAGDLNDIQRMPRFLKSPLQ